MTIRTLSAKYGITEEKALEILEKNGIFCFDKDIPFTETKAVRAEKIIADAIDPEAKMKKLLSRDCVIFTHMSLFRKNICKVLVTTLQMKAEGKSRTQIVMAEAAVNDVLHSKNPELNDVQQFLRTMKENNAMKLLPGPIVRENDILQKYITEMPIEKTIIVIGSIASLSLFIANRNQRFKGTPNYKFIYEREVSSEGNLVNPTKGKRAFCELTTQEKAPFSDIPLTLQGEIPGTGKTVYVENKGEKTAFTLGSEIGNGAEACVYKLSDGKCAKIFRAEALTELKIEKVKTMVSRYKQMRSIDTPVMERIAWPQALLYNEAGEAVGYVMAFFENTHVFAEYNEYTFCEFVKDVDKDKQLTMAISLATLVSFLHWHNIVLGDLNRMNILFDDEQRGYIIDLDSAQFADQTYYYATNVGSPQYLSPSNVYRKHFDYVRKKADDVWALQIFLFLLITPAIDPLATSYDYDDEREVIAKGLYAYQSGNTPAHEPMRGTRNHIIMSHLPSYIRDAFWHAFNGSGDHFSDEKRRSASSWLNLMVRYQTNLASIVDEDPNSGLFLPEKYRVNPKKAPRVNISGAALDALNNLSWEKIRQV